MSWPRMLLCEIAMDTEIMERLEIDCLAEAKVTRKLANQSVRTPLLGRSVEPQCPSSRDLNKWELKRRKGHRGDDDLEASLFQQYHLLTLHSFSSTPLLLMDMEENMTKMSGMLLNIKWGLLFS